MFNVWFDAKDGQYCVTVYRFVSGKRCFTMSIDLSPQELIMLRDTIDVKLAKADADSNVQPMEGA